jgi:hypothetical protein
MGCVIAEPLGFSANGAKQFAPFAYWESGCRARLRASINWIANIPPRTNKT